MNVRRSLKQQNTQNKKKDTVMKMKNKVISVIIAMAHWKWIPALMTLTLVAGLIGVDGCGKHAH